jgi:hypothetical protein
MVLGTCERKDERRSPARDDPVQMAVAVAGYRPDPDGIVVQMTIAEPVGRQRP